MRMRDSSVDSRRNLRGRKGRYHWEGVDEVAVDGVEGPRVVVCGRADGRQVYRLQIQRAAVSSAEGVGGKS
jgi:hypothetical protein